MAITYRIVRTFFNDDEAPEVIKRGLTLEEARDHCRDPETSSRTATTKAAVACTKLHGPWFDGYEEE